MVVVRGASVPVEAVELMVSALEARGFQVLLHDFVTAAVEDPLPFAITYKAPGLVVWAGLSTVKVWAFDLRAPRVVASQIFEVPTDRPSDAEIVLEAAETLRVMIRPPQAPAVRPTEPTPAPVSSTTPSAGPEASTSTSLGSVSRTAPSPLSKFSVALGTGILVGGSGSAVSPVATLNGRYAWRPWWYSDATANFSLSPSTMSDGDQHARLSAVGLDLGSGLLLDPATKIKVRLGAGIGVWRLTARLFDGDGSANTVDGWATLPTLAAGAEWAATSWLGLEANVSGGTLLPTTVVRFSSGRETSWGDFVGRFALGARFRIEK